MKQVCLERDASPSAGRLTFCGKTSAASPGFASLGEREVKAIVQVGEQGRARYSIENLHARAQSNLVGAPQSAGAGPAVRWSIVYASSCSAHGNSAMAPFSVEGRIDHPISL